MKDVHPSCVTKLNLTRSNVQNFVHAGVLAGKDHIQLSSELGEALSQSGLSFHQLSDSVFQGADDAASEIALKAPVAAADFSRLVDVFRGLGGSTDGYLPPSYVSQAASRKWFAAGRLQMSHVLWQVLHNVAPSLEEMGHSLAFRLHADETPLYQTGDCVTFAEERTITTRRVHQGVSIPIGGGLYYHVADSGQERQSGLLPIDGGKILVTDKAIYFGGQQKSFRIPFTRVLAFHPYLDAVGVSEDGKATKVFVFDYRGMDTGWFYYNLLEAASRFDKRRASNTLS